MINQDVRGGGAAAGMEQIRCEGACFFNFCRGVEWHLLRRALGAWRGGGVADLGDVPPVVVAAPVGRRERPQVLMVDGQPAVLFTGASMDRLGGMAHTFTLAQAIATDP